MDYSLSKIDPEKEHNKSVLITAWRRLFPLMKEEKRHVMIAIFAMVISSAVSLATPAIIAHIVDTFIVTKDYHGTMLFSAILIVLFIVGLFSTYVQIATMGGVGRRILFRLRNNIFGKLQELPVAFFNQNKSGDLISRINNDTEKLNQFFAQALMQFVGNIILIAGTGVFILVTHLKLGALAIVPAILAMVFTQLLGPLIKRANIRSLRTLGVMSAEIQENIANFRVIVAFNRVDYFRKKFKEVNEQNYAASVWAGVVGNIFNPIYVLASFLAQLAVLAYGIHLISIGQFTIGLLIGFFLYVNNFYNPLRQLASVWTSLQLALAGLDRILDVLEMESDMKNFGHDEETPDTYSHNTGIIEFKDVSFCYDDGKYVLKDINFVLQQGKTYALVGPTGGGKTTTASLMARLYDASEGTVYLAGKDIRFYSSEERTTKVGFILQDPFLFNGTIRENILYGNEKYRAYSNDAFMQLLEKVQLHKLVSRFPDGLDTRVTSTGSNISLGQKQLIAFMRAVLRNPDVLILDEATANIDTVTEQLLEEIIDKLPERTTKVIIAHRLNTIENADDIFFVNDGRVVHAGSMEHAVAMLLHEKRQS